MDPMTIETLKKQLITPIENSFNVVEPEEVLKAINTIKEFCRQTSSKDCDEGKCEIHTWCNEYSNILPEEWKAGEQE